MLPRMHTEAIDYAYDGQALRGYLAVDEPAALIAWLCGPTSAGVTGAALPVDGGMTTS